MTETLRELNKEAIKDGLLLPDGRSYHEYFDQLLGKPLTCREQKAYSLIQECIGLTTAEELAKKMYPDYSKTHLEDYATESIYVLINALKKKLGETAIILQKDQGYVSRRFLIMSDVEESVKKVSLPGTEPSVYTSRT